MELSLFDQRVKSSLGFALAAEIEDVPEEPGIYAWYLPMRGDSSGDLLQFLRSLEANVEAAVPATSMSGEGRQRRFILERNPPKFDFNSVAVQKLAGTLSTGKIQTLANVVLVLSFLTEPIYVGMTEANKGLRSRLKQHLQSVKTFDNDSNWSGAFRSRVAKVLQDPKYLRRCLIVYMPISSLELGEHSIRLLEHILIRTVRPSQSVRG